MRALLNDASPSLGFCPDVGWIAKGGGDLWAVLEMLKERTYIVHLKDFASTTPIKEGSLDTVEFGKGVGEFDSGNVEFEAFGQVGGVGFAFGQGGHGGRIVEQEGRFGVSQMGFDRVQKDFEIGQVEGIVRIYGRVGSGLLEKGLQMLSQNLVEGLLLG